MVPRTYAFLFVLMFAAVAYPQLPLLPGEEKAVAEAKERRARIVEQIAGDIAGLRLAENRAFVLARSGMLICRDDKEAAKAMFQRAVGELTTAQLAAESEERSGPSQSYVQINRNLRPNILTLIGGCDAEMALESLYRTRTPSILRDLAAPPEITGRQIANPNTYFSQTAQTELMLEQRLLGLAAQQNPEIAAKVIQDSIKKGLSAETLGLLKRLYQKDPETAATLARETLDRLLAGNFTPEPEDRNEIALANSILSDHLRQARPGTKELRFDDLQLRSLASKYISYTIAQSSRFPTAGNFSQAIRIAEKWSPAAVAGLRKLERERRPPGTQPQQMNPDARRIIDSKSTPTQMMADAKRLPADDRQFVYQSAANKMAAAGDYDGAIAVLNQNFAGRALENAMNSLNAYHAGVLGNQGRWQEAENLIDQITLENVRRSAMLELASRAHAKDAQGNKGIALNLLRKVRNSMPNRPADQASTIWFVQLATAYAPIEAEEAFSLMDAVVPVLNELADANSIVSAFRSDSQVRQGEYLMVPNPAYGFQVVPSAWRALMKADEERTSKLIDSFARREIRISMRLQIAGDVPQPAPAVR